MVRVTKLGIISISIMSLSLILGASNESGFSLGDKLFNSLGLPSLSHGFTGTHYTGLLSIFLFLIGAILAGKVFLGKKLAVVIKMSMMLVPPIALESRVLYLRTQSGLKTLEYKLKSSHLEIRTTREGTASSWKSIKLPSMQH